MQSRAQHVGVVAADHPRAHVAEPAQAPADRPCSAQ